MPQRRQIITFELKREFKKKSSKGKLSSIIDLSGKNINKKSRDNPSYSPNDDDSSSSSRGSASPNLNDAKNKNHFMFKSPKLNRYTEGSDDDNDEPKQFVFDTEFNLNKLNGKKSASSRDKVTNNRTDDGEKSVKLKNEVTKRNRSKSKEKDSSKKKEKKKDKSPYKTDKPKSVNEKKSKSKKSKKSLEDGQQKGEKINSEKNVKVITSEFSDSDDVRIGYKKSDLVDIEHCLTIEPKNDRKERSTYDLSDKISGSRISIYSQKIIGEKKVINTVKLIENILKDSKHAKNSDFIDSQSQEIISNQQKENFLKEKNIQINKSLEEAKNSGNLAKKPIKKNISSEINSNDKTAVHSSKGSAKSVSFKN